MKTATCAQAVLLQHKGLEQNWLAKFLHVDIKPQQGPLQTSLLVSWSVFHPATWFPATITGIFPLDLALLLNQTSRTSSREKDVIYSTHIRFIL